MESPAVSEVSRVVIVGCDGLTVDGLERAGTPALDALRARSAWTLRAEAVRPTVSGPCWGSILMGCHPEEHGIHDNEIGPEEHKGTPEALGMTGPIPTALRAVREQRPDAGVACFQEWHGITHLYEHDALDICQDAHSPEETMEAAIAHFIDYRPDIMFIQLDHLDDAGHSSRYDSPAYLEAVERLDLLINRLVRLLDKTRLFASTHVLIVSDHGGIERRHGGDSDAEVYVPWIFSGPKAKQGFEIPARVSIADTAPTALHALGLTLPSAWTGRVVTEAFA